MEANRSSLESRIQQVRNVRTVLLRLHKELLESERLVYEQFYGKIPSKGEFFRLVIGHDWFSWLRPISQFIVQIDETLSAKESVTLDQANQLLDEARKLLSPLEDGTTLQKRYYRAIQHYPDIALLHAEISQLLKN